MNRTDHTHDERPTAAVVTEWGRSEAAHDLTTLMAEAVTALTAAARQGYDAGEIICHVVTTVAANLGSTDMLLAARPGSWEADCVRNMVDSTAGDHLLSWRTAPVHLLLDPQVALGDLGLEDLYDDAVFALENEREDRIQAGADETHTEQQLRAVHYLYKDDLRNYAAAYAETLNQVAAELGITVPVELMVVGDGRAEPTWDELAQQMHSQARDRTPLPASGRPPMDYDGLPGDVDRTAGLTYLSRTGYGTPALDSGAGVSSP
jgi:hypothetical protein